MPSLASAVSSPSSEDAPAPVLLVTRSSWATTQQQCQTLRRREKEEKSPRWEKLAPQQGKIQSLLNQITLILHNSHGTKQSKATIPGAGITEQDLSSPCTRLAAHPSFTSPPSPEQAAYLWPSLRAKALTSTQSLSRPLVQEQKSLSAHLCKYKIFARPRSD